MAKAGAKWVWNGEDLRAWLQAGAEGDVARLRELDAALPVEASAPRDNNRMDPLMLACNGRHWEAAVALAQLRPQWIESHVAGYSRGRNFLHLAASKIPLDVLETLCLAAPWAAGVADGQGSYPETEAALMGNVAAAIYLKKRRREISPDPALDAQTFEFACPSLSSLDQALELAEGVDFGARQGGRAMPFREAFKSRLGAKLALWIADRARESRPQEERSAMLYEMGAAQGICDLLSSCPRDEEGAGLLALRLWERLDLQSNGACELVAHTLRQLNPAVLERKGFESARDFLSQALRGALEASSAPAPSSKAGPRL